MANIAYRHTNVPVSPLSLPDLLRIELTTVNHRQGVAALDDLVRGARASGYGSLRINVDPSLWQYVGVSGTYSVTDMWQEIPVAQIVGVLDAVRNRALNFALEIEKLDPKAGDAAGEHHSLPSERVNQVFQTVITGGVVTMAAGNRQATQNVDVIVNPGDLDSLFARIRQLGLGDDDIADLKDALNADGPISPTASPGASVSAWMWRASAKLASMAGGVGAGTAAGVLATAIARFLGVG